MVRSSPFIVGAAAVVLASSILASAAQAANGKCTLNANKASGTYGYAAEGVATGYTPLD